MKKSSGNQDELQEHVEVATDKSIKEEPTECNANRGAQGDTKNADTADRKSFQVRYSDAPDDYAVLACHLCPFSGGHKALMKHAKRTHGYSSATEYNAAHGALKFKRHVRHLCRVCDEDLLYEHKILVKHLEKHDMSLEQYRQKFLDNK